MWSSRTIPPKQDEVQLSRHCVSQVKCPLLLNDQNVTYRVFRNVSLDLNKNFQENPSIFFRQWHRVLKVEFQESPSNERGNTAEKVSRHALFVGHGRKVYDMVFRENASNGR